MGKCPYCGMDYTTFGPDGAECVCRDWKQSHAPKGVYYD